MSIAAPAGQTGNAAAQQASGATVGSQTSGSQTLAGPTSAEAAKANLTLGTGTTKVAMLLPLSAPEARARTAEKCMMARGWPWPIWATSS